MTTMNTDYFAGLELAQQEIDQAADAAANAAKKAEEEKAEADRLAYVAREELARKNIAKSRFAIRSEIVKAAIARGSVATTEEETNNVLIDGIDCGFWIDYVQERTSSTYSWRSKPTGKLRLSIGDYGSRRSFPQRKDGGHNYEEVAAILCSLVAQKKSRDLATANQQRNRATAEAIRKEFNLPEYHDLVAPSASKDVAVMLDFSKISSVTISPEKAREVLAALRGLGIKLSYNG